MNVPDSRKGVWGGVKLPRVPAKEKPQKINLKFENQQHIYTHKKNNF